MVLLITYPRKLACKYCQLQLTRCSSVSEILSGKPYGLETDVWSLGGVLLTCLSGQLAFNVGVFEFHVVSAFLNWFD